MNCTARGRDCVERSGWGVAGGLSRLRHAARAGEESRDVLAFIGKFGDLFGGDGRGGIIHFLYVRLLRIVARFDGVGQFSRWDECT